MKNKYAKTMLLSLLVLLALSNSSMLCAQEETDEAYYWEVFYTVDTVFSKPKSNRLMVNAGVQGEGARNFGGYGYGRIYVGPCLVSAFVAMLPLPGNNYSIQEATGVLCFGGASEKKKGKATTVDYATVPMNFKTGGRHKIISAQDVTYTSVSYSSPHGPNNAYVTKTTTSITRKENVKKVFRSYANLDVPTYTKAGLSFGAYNWKRYNPTAGIVTTQGFSFGLVAAINKKAKYRFHFKEHVNKVEILGLGRFIETPTDKIRKQGSRVSRVNSTYDVGLEFLYAPTMQFQNTMYLPFGADSTASMINIPKKHFGFRIRMEIRQKLVSLRAEMGMRPGPKLRAGGARGEDNAFTNGFLRGAYVIFGVGFGIGAL